MGKQLHDSVKEFKQFVKQYPDLIKEVRESDEGWQPVYEKWVLLGEEDDFWTQYKEKEKEASVKEGEESKPEEESTEEEQDEKEVMGQLMGMLDKVDLNKVQGHIQQLNGAITNIQSLVGQFQDFKRQGSTSDTKKSTPFYFGKD
ncbi:hypothetical protein N781_12850 [Pontibacillus halophilus JSM 076056 = DSM 19796]|uniref:Uncharacterized protein n=1 Tax=Pontibacillus halophilus JSM 076056 = DSM 19796 TaxID=1385510 RepID=A0A0A5GMR2_9BACI|nr:spore coat protein YlbD [Pontibacillus halophilus]KGX93289.1 hypothetical protein N781_12850 [Pontibacillus halophilus JSM 076056 = DSM 19796]